MKVSKIMTVAASLAVSVLLAQQAQAAELWISSNCCGGSNSAVGRVPDTGGTISPEFLDTSASIAGMAFDGTDLWGYEGKNPNSTLYRINQTDGTMTTIGAHAESWGSGLTYDVQNDILWGNTGGGTDEIYQISRADGSISGKVPVDMSGKGGRLDGLAYDWVSDILYGIAETGQVVTIDRTTGDTVQVANASGQFVDMAWQDGFLYTHHCCQSGQGMLKIDPSNGNVVNLGALTASPGFERRNGWAPTVIPEPASLALLGLGGLMMLRRRR